MVRDHGEVGEYYEYPDKITFEPFEGLLFLFLLSSCICLFPFLSLCFSAKYPEIKRMSCPAKWYHILLCRGKFFLRQLRKSVGKGYKAISAGKWPFRRALYKTRVSWPHSVQMTRISYKIPVGNLPIAGCISPANSVSSCTIPWHYCLSISALLIIYPLKWQKCSFDGKKATCFVHCWCSLVFLNTLFIHFFDHLSTNKIHQFASNHLHFLVTMQFCHYDCRYSVKKLKFRRHLLTQEIAVKSRAQLFFSEPVIYPYNDNFTQLGGD